MTGPTDPALRALEPRTEAGRRMHDTRHEMHVGEYDCDLARSILAIEAEALAAAEAAPLDAPSGGSPYVTRLTNSLSYHLAPEAAPLDVERLAAAMASCDGVRWPVRWTRNESHDFSWVARQVAARYAALRSPDTETAGDGT